MKHKGFRLLALMMAFLLLFSSMHLGASAAETYQNLRSENEAITYVEDYANDVSGGKEKYHVATSISINSFTPGKSYILYSFVPNGYAIYDEVSGVVEEMMLGTQNPYADVKGEKLLYGGPMNYIVEVNGKLMSISDNKELQEEDIKVVTDMEQATVKNRAEMRAIPTTVNNRYMSSSSYFTSQLGDRFGTNTSGTCTHIACAIMLGFYNHYVNTQFVPTAYENGCGTTESFHILLQSFLGASPSGLANAANGLNSYFSSIYFTSPHAYYDIGNHNTVFTRVTNNVYNNRPTVVAMFEFYNTNCTMNHSVVAYGYREELYGHELTSAAYYVHNGWHSTKTGTYAWDWFADDLYIG